MLCKQNKKKCIRFIFGIKHEFQVHHVHECCMICQMLLQYLDKRFPKGVCIFEILFHACIDEIKTIICSELIFCITRP